MAYVVARRNGRFELRESLHTARGPRARTLAGFAVLNDDALARAAARAQRPFDAAAVIDSARRAGAQVTATAQQTGRPADSDSYESRSGAADATEASHADSGGFLAATARMAHSLRHARSAERASPGEALIDLLGFADAVRASQPPRPSRPLAFPAIARLAQGRHRPIGLAHR